MLDVKILSWMMQSPANVNHIYSSVEFDLLRSIFFPKYKATLSAIHTYYSRHKTPPSYDILKSLLEKDEEEVSQLDEIVAEVVAPNEIGYFIDEIKERYNKYLIDNLAERASDLSMASEDIMDFNDSKDEAAFRAEAAAWLKDNVPSKDELAGLDELAAAKLWQKRKYDAGWACIRWDKEFGGRGASAIEQVIWNQEEAKYNVPAGFFVIGQGMAAPTLMTWGQAEHHARYLPKLASGEEIWCQLFSEPAGGSDLAALRTKAERDGDDWVINGQKIWTSGAHYSDYGILVVRTDPNVPCLLYTSPSPRDS